MDPQSVKQSVVASYSKLAKSTRKGLFPSLFACCEPGDHARQVGEQIGYSREELQSVPEGANLGVGCGNPSALARIKAGDTLIDLGAGAGFDAFLASPLVGDKGRVIGVDLSDDMLALARKNAKQGAYANVSFIKGDIEALPLEEGLADHIISNCVINLSLDKGAVYREAYRVLKSGGTLSISDIVLEQELPDLIKDSLAAHIACVAGAEPLETYLGYVKQAGFRDIRVETKTGFPLELMLADPQVKQLAAGMNLSLTSEVARDLASRVQSITLSARK